MISTTRNSSYQPIITNVKTNELLLKLLEGPVAAAEVESVHVVSKNGSNDCSHKTSCPLDLTAITLIQKNDKPFVCRCDKQLVGKVDLRFKPNEKVRKYVDCMSFSLASLLESSMQLKGLTYRLKRPHCSDCKYPKQLPKGGRLSWKLILDLKNPSNGCTLRGTQTIRCFVDTSAHTSTNLSFTFDKLLSSDNEPIAIGVENISTGQVPSTTANPTTSFSALFDASATLVTPEEIVTVIDIPAPVFADSEHCPLDYIPDYLYSQFQDLVSAPDIPVLDEWPLNQSIELPLPADDSALLDLSASFIDSLPQNKVA